jgi:diguanylate cyclase (GGDEF)-like protein
VLAQLDSLVGGGSTVGAVFVDLDGFKRVNDAFGHATGDAVLVAVSCRVRECVREHDIVGRLGGDEFLVVCPDVEDAAAVVAVATRISNMLTVPLALDEGSIRIQASIGVAIAGAGHQPDALVASADAAMYVSKRNGDGRPVAA